MEQTDEGGPVAHDDVVLAVTAGDLEAGA